MHTVFCFMEGTVYWFVGKAVAMPVAGSKNMEGRLETMVFKITGVRIRAAETTSLSPCVIARFTSLLVRRDNFHENIKITHNRKYADLIIVKSEGKFHMISSLVHCGASLGTTEHPAEKALR